MRSKYPENHKWNKGEGSSAYEIEKDWNKNVSTLPRKPQAGKRRSGKHIGEILLTHYFEFNISAGEDHWKRLRKDFPNDVEYYEKCEEYFNDARDVLKELYPYGVMIKWKTHYEEKAPHCHCDILPIIMAPKRLNKKKWEEEEKKRKAGEIIKKRESILKYSVGEFLGGEEGLYKLQNTMFGKLGSKWQVDRGEIASDARHTDQTEWQRNLSIQAKEITEGLKIINETTEFQKQEKEEIKQSKNEVEKLKTDVHFELEKTIHEGKKIANELKKEAIEESNKLIEEGKKIKNLAFQTANDIVKAAEAKRDKEQKLIIDASKVSLKNIGLPEPLKREDAISYVGRVQGWFKGIISKIINRENALKEKENELDKKNKEVDFQLSKLIGNYGEENMIKQAIILLYQKLKAIHEKKGKKVIESNKKYKV